MRMRGAVVERGRFTLGPVDLEICLVLDEPTNRLDLPAIEQLEQALEGYDGALLAVSHDRRLLETVALTRAISVSGGEVELGGP